MDSFVFGYVQPAILPFVDRHSVARYLDYGVADPPRPALIYFADPADAALQEKLRVLRAVTFSLLGKVVVVWTDRTRTIPLQHRLFGDVENAAPGSYEDLLVLLLPRQHRHYIMPQDISIRLDPIVSWAFDALRGRVAPTTKPLPPNLSSSSSVVLHVTDRGPHGAVSLPPFVC